LPVGDGKLVVTTKDVVFGDVAVVIVVVRVIIIMDNENLMIV
jgi:hypothetical protein